MGPEGLVIRGALHAGGETEAWGERWTLPAVEPSFISMNRHAFAHARTHAHTHNCSTLSSSRAAFSLDQPPHCRPSQAFPPLLESQ